MAMQKLSLILFYLIITTSNVIVAQDRELSLNERIGINNLKDHVTYKRKTAVARQIKYPLMRCDYFEYYISDANDFIDSFDIIFDSEQIEEFRASQWEYLYDQSYDNYTLWGSGYSGEFNEEGVIHLTYIPLSETENIYIQKLIDKEKNCLHPNLRNYIEPVCLLYAGKYRIRIDLMQDGNVRYSSWKKDADISSIPDLVIYGGEISGNRWYRTYVFKNNEYEYRIDESLVGEELSEIGPSFTVSKNGKIIMEISPRDIQIKWFYF